MQCPLCGHDRAYKHGKTSKGGQRYLCPCCEKTFTDTFGVKQRFDKFTVTVAGKPYPD